MKRKAQKPPPLSESDWGRVFRLRCRSKQGEYLSPEDIAFLRRAYDSDNDRHSNMDRDVFEATKPFGA